jgi:hypothetical protein
MRARKEAGRKAAEAGTASSGGPASGSGPAPADERPPVGNSAGDSTDSGPKPDYNTNSLFERGMDNRQENNGPQINTDVNRPFIEDDTGHTETNGPQIDTDVNRPFIDEDSSKEQRVPPRTDFGFYGAGTSDPRKLIDEFIKRAEALYEDFFKRIDINNWNELLNSDIMWDMSSKPALNQRFLEFLSAHRYYPLDIWKLMDSHFKWSEPTNLSYASIFRGLDKYIAFQLGREKGLDYSCFKSSDNIDFAKFAEYRDEAWQHPGLFR